MLQLRPVALLTGLTIVLGACAQTHGVTGTPPGVSINCTADYRRPDWAALEVQTSLALERWQAQQPTEYAYTATVQNASGTFEAQVVVRGGVVAQVYDLRTNAPLDPVFRPLFPTLEAVFENLRVTIARERADVNSCRVLRLEFDPAKGFPTLVDTVNLRRDVQDGGGIFRVSRVDPVVKG